MKRWLAVIVLLGAPANATSGGLNAEGCHTDRKGGTGHHCHRAKAHAAGQIRAVGRVSPSTGVFRNCSAARAAGAAPVYRGDLGYGPHLDRDDDGVGCE